MILRESTIRWKGYDPSDLTKGSHKRICVSCDECGRVRYVRFQDYRDLCYGCKMRSEKIRQKMSDVKKGKNNGMYGKTHTKKQKDKWSRDRKDKNLGENNSFYGYKHCDETKEKISQSLIKHHYIYDHNDLSKYTMLITRKQHGKIHSLMRKIGISILHINEVIK